MEIPFIDWDGSGRIDPSDIAISLGMAEEAENEFEDEYDDGFAEDDD